MSAQEAGQDFKVVINTNDVPEDTERFIVNISKNALQRFNLEKDIAAFIKKEVDKEYKSTWHVYVGRNFSSYVTHDKNRFIDFNIGQLAFQVFQCG
ncbi:Dynein light chain [Spironucleus salmonicida]|uniref:Dynein light chain n=1 Tax=Spironucleus salmonicida TaxID=348837 RepID=V6M5F0_9EUKA|nr:Dynein light chain [Spironucleus salmonicida]|eukprot:EST48589.1 Dynein light chain [Spironucleus salmonicida]